MLDVELPVHLTEGISRQEAQPGPRLVRDKPADEVRQVSFDRFGCVLLCEIRKGRLAELLSLLKAFPVSPQLLPGLDWMPPRQVSLELTTRTGILWYTCLATHSV